MDTITAFVIVFVAFGSALGLVGLGAIRWGVDSRPKIGDTHAR